MAERAPLSTLSSLLAGRGVPMRAIEDAIARQVVHGSDLATNLLEVGGVGEELLLAVLAEASGLEAAPLGSLPAASHEALRLVSADMASEHNVMPLSLSGAALKVAVAEPFIDATAALGLGSPFTVVQLVAPLARIRQAISKAYRMPLERRFTRLLGKLGEPGAMPGESRFDIQDEPTQVSALPFVEMAASRPATQTPSTLLTGGKPVPVAPAAPKQAPPEQPTRRKESEPPAASPAGGSVDSVGAPTIPPQTIPGDVALAKGNAPAWTTRVPVVQVVEPPADWRPLTSDDMPETVPAQRLAAMAGKAETKASGEEEGAPVSRRTAGSVRRDTARGRAAGGFFRRTVVGEHKAREQVRKAEIEAPVQERRGSVRVRRKGPFTAQMAEEELVTAATTDVVLDILFSFAHQFFEYTVLFVVSGELADGRDASGPGLTATQIKNVRIPLDQPSMLQLARERKAPVTVSPVSHGVDVQIVRDLAREARFETGYRATIAILPVVVKNRVVALLLGDDGNVDVDLSALGDVIIVLGRTVEALERIILRKKLGAAGRSPSVAPPAMPTSERGEGLRPVGLAALARALDTSTGVDSESAVESQVASLPPTKSAPTATLISAAAIRSQESPSPPVRRDPPDVLPRSARQAARSSGTNHSDATSSSGEPAPDGDVPDPAAPSERSGPGSRRRRFLNGPLSRPRIAPVAHFDAGADVSDEPPQQTVQGLPRSQRRGFTPTFGGRSRTVVAPRPLPANLGSAGKPAAPSATPSTLAGPPLPPTVQAKRLGGLERQTFADTSNLAVQQAERETVALLQRFVESNGADDDAGQAIVQMGERALPAIMVRFPGPLAPGIDRDSTDLPAASSCGPLFALVVAIGADAVLQVAQRATSILSEDRFWAAHVLGEIACIESAEVVGTLLFDEDASVRRVARRSATNLMASVPDAASVLAPMLEQAARSPADRPGRRVIALETLGELAIPSTMPALIAMLADPVHDVADAVHRALVQMACQDFGRDTRRWSDWFSANASRHRVEWIIDSLLHDSAELRRMAADALAPVINRDLGFDADAARDERAAAHVRYLLWWEQEGRTQFAQ